MSELTTCNYCMLRSMERRCPDDRRLIQRAGVVSGHSKMSSWITIYSVPKAVTLGAFDRLTRKGRERYFAASFMALTDHCVC
jgi:hypothetical protein